MHELFHISWAKKVAGFGYVVGEPGYNSNSCLHFFLISLTDLGPVTLGGIL
jgi:hypothetical protein